MNAPVVPEIRRITTPDDPLFYDAKRLNDTTHAYHLSWLDSPCLNYVALDTSISEKVIGVIQVEDYSQARDHIRGDAYISRLAVDGEYRRIGIGSLLVAHAVNIAREANLTLMSTITMAPSAAAFFERQGFVCDPQRRNSRFTRYLDLSLPAGPPNKPANDITSE